MKNIIALQKGFIVAEEANKNDNKQFQMTIQAELMQLGYILSDDAVQYATFNWLNDVITHLKKTLGASRSYRPFYANFPKEVMNLSHYELFRNAILHYRSNGVWEPSSELVSNGFKYENTDFKIIKLATEEEFAKIFTTLVSINSSLTEGDKQIVEWFVKNYPNLKLPDNIPFKETLCALVALGVDVRVSNTTDVLRIAVFLSGGDISLPKITKKNKTQFKFKKFSRPERRYLLNVLENTNLDVSEMKLKLGRWLRLGEILHIGEYKDIYPKSFKAFQLLRNDVSSIKTFNSQVELALNTDVNNAIYILSKRPGEFTRRLDFLLRTYKLSTDKILNAFIKVSNKVSKKVLWELYSHFNKRNVAATRTIMIKGKRAKQVTLDALPILSEELIHKVKETILLCLGEHFKQLEPLGSVYIDPQLQKVPIPSAMRSLNTAIKTYVRGSRFPFSETANVIRPYIHWFDQYGYEDLDLSAGFYNDKFKLISHLSYTNLKDNRLNSCHSGDVRHRKGACAEYVDIDVKKSLSVGVRYVVVQVYNFESRPMHSLTDCVFGLMEREFPESNNTFLPKTISNAMQVANESSCVNIVILDLLNKEYIWADLESTTRGLSNFESTTVSTERQLISLVTTPSISVYDVLAIHAKARGVEVFTPETADVVFSYEDFVTSYEKVATFM